MAVKYIIIYNISHVSQKLNGEVFVDCCLPASNCFSDCGMSSILQGLVDFDGYYLEHDPCLVCNNPEIPFVVR